MNIYYSAVDSDFYHAITKPLYEVYRSRLSVLHKKYLRGEDFDFDKEYKTLTSAYEAQLKPFYDIFYLQREKHTE